MELTVYYNGELMKSSETPVSIYDHGFLFGDGIKINVKCYHKKPFMIKEHLKDLSESAEKLGIKIPLAPAAVEKAIKVLLDLNSLEEALVSLIVTRGEGLHFTPNIQYSSNILIMTNSPVQIPDQMKYQGIQMAVSEFRAYPKSHFDRQIFTISSQQEVFILYEAFKKQAFEALLINMEGYVSEGSRSNIFLIKDGKLYTPDLECNVRNLVTRRVVLKIAKHLKIPVFEAFISVKQLWEAEECFIAAPELELLPVIKIDQKNVGEGYPGKFTSQIIQTYKKLTEEGVSEIFLD